MDQFKNRILAAANAREAKNIEADEKEAAQTAKLKEDYQAFEKLIRMLVVPTFKELSELFQEADAPSEIAYDLREDGGCPEANYNSVTFHFAVSKKREPAPPPLKLTGCEVKVMRSPGDEQITLSSSYRTPSSTDKTTSRKLKKEELSRELLMDFVVSVFEKIT